MISLRIVADFTVILRARKDVYEARGFIIHWISVCIPLRKYLMQCSGEKDAYKGR